MASHGSDTPTSPGAILHHTDTILCTFMHTTVSEIFYQTYKNHVHKFNLFTLAEDHEIDLYVPMYVKVSTMYLQDCPGSFIKINIFLESF